MKLNKLISLLACIMLIFTLAGGCKKKEDSGSSSGSYSGTMNNTGNPSGNSLSLGSNSPVTVGTNLTLTAASITGASYYWTGPNGFSSYDQNPVRANFTVADAGTYNCKATVNYSGTYSGSIVVAAK